MDHLQEQFQLASVRQLHFQGTILDENINPYLTFVRLCTFALDCAQPSIQLQRQPQADL